MKPKFSVALRADTMLPVELLKPTITETPVGDLPVLTCTEVQEAFFGLLRLTLELDLSTDQRRGPVVPMHVFVPQDQIAWMLQAQSDSSLGFLAEALRAKPRSGQAG